LIDEIEA